MDERSTTNYKKEWLWKTLHVWPMLKSCPNSFQSTSFGDLASLFIIYINYCIRYLTSLKNKEQSRLESFRANNKNIMQPRPIFYWLQNLKKKLFIRLYFFAWYSFIRFQSLALFDNCSFLILKKNSWEWYYRAYLSIFFYLDYFSFLTSGNTTVGKISKFTSIFFDKIHYK